MKQRENIIYNYVDAYNSFDIDRMLKDVAPEIRSENISNGQVTMSISGLPALQEQALQATQLFTQRRQTITAFQHTGQQTTIEIDYTATLAVDLPNGLKKGDELALKGQSIFTFSDNTIIGITDIS